ncbi:MAG: YhfC family intramembrane metalloprotease [Turicibacter sp.]|nr:YhfC family intramembrane metalloprotease [Turicibacter sp.]
MVSTFAMIMMGLTAFICFLVPLGTLYWIRRRYQASLKSFLIGMVMFIVMVQILEGLFHLYLLKINQTTAAWLMQPFIYAIYGGLMAGVFEETGRYVSFKWFLKKETRIQDALSYGIGHGGIEAMLIVGTTYVNNLIVSFLINQGQLLMLGLGGEVEEQIVTQLTQLPPFIFGLAGYERFMTFIIQVGLSVLVFKAVKERKKYFYILAIVIHALLDIPAALAQVGVSNVYVVEGIVTFVAILFVIFMLKQLKVYRQDLKQPEDPELEGYQKAGY